MDSCKKEGFQDQELCNNKPSPLPFGIKEVWILTQVVPWDTSPPYSQSAGFPNKVAILCPNTVPLDVLASCEGSSMSLGLVTNWLRNSAVCPLSPRVIWCPDNKVSQCVMGSLDHHCPRFIQEIGSPGSGQRSFPSSPILIELRPVLEQG